MALRGEHFRRWGALLLVLLIAVVWLNQGPSLRRFTAEHPSSPFAFLYRRAPDEEMYFATASATLGKPYDREAFAIRGATSLPPVDVAADGRFHLPYAEVPFEYPPPNVPFVLAPRLVANGFEGYARVFGAVMGLLLVGSALLARRIADSPLRMLAFGGLLLAHGALAIQRLDAIVAVLVLLMVDAALHSRDRATGFWGGLATATKIVPVVVLVAVAVAGGDLKRRWRSLVVGSVAGIAVGFGPQILLAPQSLGALLHYHGARGLHVESSLGVLYGAVVRERATLDFGSFNFHGTVADGLAKASPLVLLALVALLLRAAHGSKQIVLAAIAACLALWLGGKVFSPQYLTWALPLVIALPDRSWRQATWALGGVLLLSQLYYRGYYDHVYRQLPLGVATMVVRLALLGAFFAWAIRRLWRERAIPDANAR